MPKQGGENNRANDSPGHRLMDGIFFIVRHFLGVKSIVWGLRAYMRPARNEALGKASLDLSFGSFVLPGLSMPSWSLSSPVFML